MRGRACLALAYTLTGIGLCCNICINLDWYEVKTSGEKKEIHSHLIQLWRDFSAL